MHIQALQKTTTLDFPGHVAALVFTRGCNFHCPYCHNPELIDAGPGALAQEDVLAFLQKRKNVLQGLVISGGEPALQEDLPEFCASAKALGYAVKLDTNGSRPAMLEELLRRQLLDYVALDLKTGPGDYAPHISTQGREEALLRCLELLARSGLPHEYRITAAAPMISAQSFARLLDVTESSAPLFLQPLRLEKVLNPGFFTSGPGRALGAQELDELRSMALSRGRSCAIR